MTSRERLLVAIVVGLAASGMGCMRQSGTTVYEREAAALSEGTERPSLAEISAYRDWNCVNAPTPMDPATANLCITLSPPVPRDALGPSTKSVSVPKGDPHAGKLISVYVNGVGLTSMFDEHPRFPCGTIIVKQKLPTPESIDWSSLTGPQPELLTVMVKREPGYDPEYGDWEYLGLDGPATKIIARGKLDNCRGCHASERSTDFVFRQYLPADVRQRVRETTLKGIAQSTSE
ncbi:MAG TPA: cytochrome P460 family protein [Pirellulales bacterium]|jgi:hypothetical protein|nr:cytochrome P460 family protein [Pirellulales bacterium]